MVESEDHDACITWRLGNGTVILQNVVTYESECTPAKLDFWTRFINLYYQVITRRDNLRQTFIQKIGQLSLSRAQEVRSVAATRMAATPAPSTTTLR